ncbi:hypothetical protein EV126DRAFT_76300 [Verticillium dahliae]|nr:hypothetical protein EV126DRAFT_76300 [Verticillium dahliae]
MRHASPPECGEETEESRLLAPQIAPAPVYPNPTAGPCSTLGEALAASTSTEAAELRTSSYSLSLPLVCVSPEPSLPPPLPARAQGKVARSAHACRVNPAHSESLGQIRAQHQHHPSDVGSERRPGTSVSRSPTTAVFPFSAMWRLRGGGVGEFGGDRRAGPPNPRCHSPPPPPGRPMTADERDPTSTQSAGVSRTQLQEIERFHFPWRGMGGQFPLFFFNAVAVARYY